LHKLICKTLKRLSCQLQPYHEVARIIEAICEEIDDKKKQQKTRILLHLIPYAEHQFGDRVLGNTYRERVDSERINNWRVEIGILIHLYLELTYIYRDDDTLSFVVRDTLNFPYYEKILELLEPWSAYLDLDCTGQIDSLDNDQINLTVIAFSQAEHNIGSIHMHRNDFNLAENYCQRALSCARLYEGKEEWKTELLCTALKAYYELRSKEGNHADALIYAEEAYNCVAIAYNPVHPKVQDAASMLIKCLIFKGNLDSAETFAQMTLDSLKDPGNGLDQQSEAVARGYYDFGDVIYQQQGDLVKAEKLTRESLRIRTRLYDNNHANVGLSVGLLASILQSLGKLGRETLEFYERSLAIEIKNYGLEGINTATSNFNLGFFYHNRAENSHTAEKRKDDLRLSESFYKEAERIRIKIYGPDNPGTVRAASQLSITSHELSKT
jgi:tetratricopeptide (TPR) repeat protein